MLPAYGWKIFYFINCAKNHFSFYVLHVAVVASESPDDGDGNGDPVVREQFVDCVFKLDVSSDSAITTGSLLISLLL